MENRQFFDRRQLLRLSGGAASAAFLAACGASLRPPTLASTATGVPTVPTEANLTLVRELTRAEIDSIASTLDNPAYYRDLFADTANHPPTYTEMQLVNGIYIFYYSPDNKSPVFVKQSVITSKAAAMGNTGVGLFLSSEASPRVQLLVNVGINETTLGEFQSQEGVNKVRYLLERHESTHIYQSSEEFYAMCRALGWDVNRPIPALETESQLETFFQNVLHPVTKQLTPIKELWAYVIQAYYAHMNDTWVRNPHGKYSVSEIKRPDKPSVYIPYTRDGVDKNGQRVIRSVPQIGYFDLIQDKTFFDLLDQAKNKQLSVTQFLDAMVIANFDWKQSSHYQDIMTTLGAPTILQAAALDPEFVNNRLSIVSTIEQ